MKKNMIKKALRCSLIFSLSMQGLLISAQEISRTFSKSIQVSPEVAIFTKGPRALTIEMSGKMHMTSRKDDYILLPGGNNGVPALVIKDYTVSTWDKNELQQTVDITILPDEAAPQDATDLMNHLTMNLQPYLSNKIKIDDNLNISKINMVNGFFKSNITTITLTNGKQYQIKSMTIKSSLQIPRTCQLNISSKYVGIYIGDHTGKLQLDLESSEVTLGNANQLEASLKFVNLTGKHITSAKLTASNTQFSVDKVDTLIIGKPVHQSTGSLFGHKASSSSNKYLLETAGRLLIQETANDQFQIGALDHMSAANSTFSNYDIKSLHGSLNLSAKNGDLNLQTVKEGFESIIIDNHISTVNIGLQTTSNYKVEIDRNIYTELNFPIHLSTTKTELSPGTIFTKGNADKAGKINLRCDSCTIFLKD